MMPEKHHDDESWLVSYADMITLLLGFFVILFSFSTVDTEKFSQVSENITDALGKDPKAKAIDKEIQKEAISKQKRQEQALSELSKLLNMGSVTEFVGKMEGAKERKAAVDAAKDLLGEGGSDSENIMEIIIPDDTLFASGQAKLNQSSIKGLDKVAKKIQGIEGDIEVQIKGNSDSSPQTELGLYPSNWSLSAARAGAVAKALEELGVSPKRLRPSGLAATNLLFPDRREDGTYISENMRRNRRVEIVIKFKE